MEIITVLFNKNTLFLNLTENDSYSRSSIISFYFIHSGQNILNQINKMILFMLKN